MRFAPILLALSLLLGACGNNEAPDATDEPAADTTSSLSSEGPDLQSDVESTDEPVDMEAPMPVAENLPGEPVDGEIQATASGLQYFVIEEGTGATPQTGDRVLVQYAGYLLDGTPFDSGQIPFPLGQGSVIRGWDEGIAMMSVGGKRKLVIPPDLAYGPTGTPGGPIPPNATLVFDVELLEIQ